MTKVHFVYLGQRIPSYALASLELAATYSGQEIVLLANEVAIRRAGNTQVQFESIENFYDPKQFMRAAKFVTYSHTFRDGFWLKGIERYFVLEQFMSDRKLEDLFHAELDQLLFDTKSLVSNLRQLNSKGLYIPFRSPTVPIASILYVNSLDALASLNQFAEGGGSFRSDNDLIGQWSRANPKMVFALPTFGASIVRSRDESSEFLNLCDEKQVGGIVDGAQLGHWIGGWDPRNVPIWQSPRTKFVPKNNLENLSREDLSSIRFRLSELGLEIQAREKENWHRIFNLHLHSKVHPFLLRRDAGLSLLLGHANGSRRWKIPGTRKTQLFDFVAITSRNAFRWVARKIRARRG